ncbi:hypothetical protein A7K98_12550 [Tatumella citrea]|uniref:Uncharacterized protein n=1 Tax=Tatumella citrea TaxID=53336 RepID=A0A1Y0L9Z2_TATCI|nr:hypothetical protein A7K98_12550 [Tatumella citrea]
MGFFSGLSITGTDLRDVVKIIVFKFTTTFLTKSGFLLVTRMLPDAERSAGDDQLKTPRHLPATFSLSDFLSTGS